MAKQWKQSLTSQNVTDAVWSDGQTHLPGQGIDWSSKTPKDTSATLTTQGTSGTTETILSVSGSGIILDAWLGWVDISGDPRYRLHLSVDGSQERTLAPDPLPSWPWISQFDSSDDEVYYRYPISGVYPFDTSFKIEVEDVSGGFERTAGGKATYVLD